MNSASATFTDCTITANYVDSRGGGLFLWEGAAVTLTRTILWGNCGGAGGNELHFNGATSMSAAFDCCDVDSSGIDGLGDVHYLEDDIFLDPQFCGPESCQNAPTAEGDFTLDSTSPCLPESSPCAQLIGARGQGCGGIPTGACCFVDGSCLVLGRSACGDQHGTYQGDGTTCDPNPCEPTPIQPTTWGRIKAGYR